ncbi:MAG: DUF4190 domain-containing protein [Candidatus Dormibacterales bacterium]
MSQTPSELPPPPPQSSAEPAATPTQIAGQQTTPSTSVPNAQGPGVGGPTPTAGSTNTLAVVSLVAGIGSFFAHIIPGIGGFTVALIAVITGFMARKQIRKTGEQGMGMATAGMVIGLIHLALLLLLVLGAIFLIFVLGIALFGIHH